MKGEISYNDNSIGENGAKLDVYVAKIPDDIVIEKVFSSFRNEEIEKVSNERVKTEKFCAWKLLGYALKNSLSLDIALLDFEREKNGKITTGVCRFSISHSFGLVAVAVSTLPVGVDIENESAFFSRVEKLGFSREKLCDKILTAVERKIYPTPSEKDLITLWTKKESIYKGSVDCYFCPSDINVADYQAVTFFDNLGGESYALSVYGDTPSIKRFEVDLKNI